MMRITALYASLLAVLFLFLSVRVIGWRRQQRVEIGHGEDVQLLRRMRVHANFAEYAPFTLLLMALAENLGPPHVLVHLVGLTLLAGRAMHAYGLSQTPHILKYRVWGMTLTFAAMGIAAMICFTLSTLYLLA
ncbi:MAG TPA: MAPEG family protein [Hyphomicrobium sp.]|jgi:uncharacterized protein|nr:MAPEG family protein [Hyphomicrobium sp.]